MKKFLFAAAILALINIQAFSQGKIISKTEADNLFGQVLITKQIPTENLKTFTNQSFNVMMFNIINNDLYILDNNRNVLTPIGVHVSNAEVFSVYSLLVIYQLISDGGSSVTFVEKRRNVLTITNGNYTLEFAILCPPICPN